MAQQTDFDSPTDFSEMVTERLPAVVGILSTGPAPDPSPAIQPQLPPGMREFFGGPTPPTPQGPMRSQGSGFIISQDGLVVTNNHVIAGAEQIEVIMDDDRRLDAELIGTDPATDIALLRIENVADLPHVVWGSSDDLSIGEWVVAIGNPFGLGGTVTAGIVSARARDINAGPYDSFIQTDAAINSGNSGGPLFHVSGDVVGVNTAIFSPTGGNVGIGFAVPSAVAERIVDDLQDDGRVERGWLGVQVQPVDEALARAFKFEDPQGVLLADVTKGSPAFEAGLEPGDVLLEIDGAAVDTPRDLTFAVADTPVGATVMVTYLRNGNRVQAEVTIGQRPDLQSATAQPDAGGRDDRSDADGPRIGVSVAPLSGELRAQAGIPNEVSGLLVQSVTQDSPAAEAGLRAGDVLVEAADVTLGQVETLRDAIARAAEEGETLLIRVFRGQGYNFVVVNLSEKVVSK
ncbi:Do family serine endopeptidase [Dinoroseobacter sp. PD6]|uniref:Do family serine endopeptidase n=1 Tax=Dinoroseobacter sp. PD6 TaxID=3028384 RepID=UPI00237AF417|nr:Do family serine endopeptidase [Dinoroseobacter sp. PD6]MDD9719012.1 Do family serine endopeptidase [Dinoroseobacter sp. PD6]